MMMSCLDVNTAYQNFCIFTVTEKMGAERFKEENNCISVFKINDTYLLNKFESPNE